MSKFISVIMLFLVSVVFSNAENVLEYFNAKSNGNNIKVEWKCANELEIQGFELERSADGGKSFTRIESFKAEGTGTSYTYNDEDPLLRDGTGEAANKIQSASTYTYRLKIVKKDNTYFYSDTVYVKHELNSIRRTWGMIKEMFR